MATFPLVKKQIFRFFIFKNKIPYLLQFIRQFFGMRNEIVLLRTQSNFFVKSDNKFMAVYRIPFRKGQLKGIGYENRKKSP